MKAQTNYSDYPDKIDQIVFQKVAEKTEIVLKVDTVLINSVATNVLNMELKNNVGEVSETSTTIQFDSEDLLDLMNGIKTLNQIITQI